MHIDRYVELKKLQYDRWTEDWKRKNAKPGNLDERTPWAVAYPLNMTLAEWEEMSLNDGV